MIINAGRSLVGNYSAVSDLGKSNCYLSEIIGLNSISTSNVTHEQGLSEENYINFPRSF